MKNLINGVDKYKQLILDAERYIWANPETGYKEVKTSKYLAEQFTALGYQLTMAENVPGFYTTIDTGKPGPTVLILGELDSVICFNHPERDKTTGAVHACGHHAQCAALLGVAAALKQPNALDGLCGKIKLCAVPAEELLELDYRTELKNKGLIKYYCGKQEFLYRGYFDDVDLAFMIHVACNNTFTCYAGAVGAVAKNITYKGKAAHAGTNPWDGNNALYAANCGINACNALRETFKESDIIRFHPIIANGGDMVNAIPDNIVVESYVRGATFTAVASANQKINQALIGGALALNCNVDIVDIPAFAPLINSKELGLVFEQATKNVAPQIPVVMDSTMISGSTDMGNLSSIMPVIHPFCPGAVGNSHGADFYITDPVLACVTSAKVQLAMVYDLLSDDGKKAKEVTKKYQAPFTNKQQYLDFFDKLACQGNRITYTDGSANIKL